MAQPGISRRSLFGGAAAVGLGAVAGGVPLPPAAQAAAPVPPSPFPQPGPPHLREAEQLVDFLRLLDAGHLTDGLVGHWAVDGSDGDLSGFGRPVRREPGAIWTTTLRSGGELSLDGPEASAATAGAVLDTTGSFSVSAWVRLLTKDVAKPDHWYTAVSQDGELTSRFLLQYDKERETWVFKVRSENETQQAVAAATTPAECGKWTHLTGVYTVATEKKLELYVNGTLAGTATTTIPAWASTRSFAIGRAKLTGEPVNRWQGAIADVRAYGRALTAADVAIVSGETGKDNNYYHTGTDPVVTWGRPNDLASWVSRARCSSFVTALLKRTYGWATEQYFQAVFAEKWPEAEDYRRVFATPGVPRLRQITRTGDLRPGDLIAIDYQLPVDNRTATGHIVVVRSVKPAYTSPFSALNFPGETQYPIELVDCSSSPHGVFGVGDYAGYPDTRVVDGVGHRDGLGYGHMMLYADTATGEFTRYRRSVNTKSDEVHPVTSQPATLPWPAPETPTMHLLAAARPL